MHLDLFFKIQGYGTLFLHSFIIKQEGPRRKFSFNSFWTTGAPNQIKGACELPACTDVWRRCFSWG